MSVKRTETIHLRENSKLSWLCHISKNLYNQGDYIIKQNWLNGHGYTKYEKVNEQLKGTENYIQLPAQTAQQTLKLLDNNWKSFFKSMEDYKENPSKYYGKPRIPNYKKKNGEYLLTLTNQQCRIKNGYLKFPKIMDMEIETRLSSYDKINHVRIVPLGVGYKCEIVYEHETQNHELNHENVASIDLGVNNVITMVNNIGKKPIVVKGGIVKSINQYFNKKLARLNSIYDKIGVDESKNLNKLYRKRNMKINDFFHKVSKKIVDYCIKNNIKTLIIGYNQGWKQNCGIGKENNQKFVQDPFFKLKNQIEYKCEDVGINVKFQDESYTSKCSFLDGEQVKKKTCYLGQRLKRGLFRSSNGTIINADVNGAYNITKKAIPGAVKGIKGVALHPVRLSHECN